MDLQGAVSQLIALIPGWLQLVMLLLGAGIIIWNFIKWLRTRDSSSGMRGFPVWQIVLGAALVSPIAIFPPVAAILQALINLVLNIIESLTP